MDEAWLQANRSVLLDAHYRLEELLDQLIQEGIFDPNEDDYQLIMAQDTPRGQLRKLLDILPLKKADSFPVFKKAMSTLCSHILERCVTPRPPKTRLGQLQDLLTASRKSKTTMRGPTPWLGSKGKLHTHTFSLDLVIADRDDLAKSMTERSSTTATEQTRRDDHYARPRARKTIPFQSLFSLTNPSQQRTDPVQATTSTSGQTVAAAAQASCSTGPDVVVSRRQEASTGTQSLCTHPKTAVWAGAGLWENWIMPTCCNAPLRRPAVAVLRSAVVVETTRTSSTKCNITGAAARRSPSRRARKQTARVC